MTKKKLEIRPRIRIMLRKNIAFGPGKADLLEALERTGSIKKAAADLSMSYMRTWTLIRTMNGCYRQPLVETASGGKLGGGRARLTETGRKVLAAYRRMEEKILRAVQPEWKRLKKMLRS